MSLQGVVSWNTFVQIGLQQEINRRLLHPMGYDLQCPFGENFEYPTLTKTDDPDGFLMEIDHGTVAGFEIMYQGFGRRRRQILGFVTQPSPHDTDIKPLLDEIRAYLTKVGNTPLLMKVEIAYSRLP